MDKLFTETLSQIEDFYTSGKLEEARKAVVDFSNEVISKAELHKTKEYLETLIRYSTAWINENPTKEAYAIRAFCYYDLKQYEQAIQDYDKAIELDPNYPAAYYGRGNSYADLKQYEQAIQDYDKAIELNPYFSGAYNARGVSYARLEQYERAIEDYNEAVELDSNYVFAYYNRGLCYARLEQYEQAIEGYSKAIEVAPTYTSAYINRGVCYRNLNQYKQAIEDYNKAIELDPTLTPAYYNRGVSYADLKQYEQAIEDYDKAIELDSIFAESYYARGNAFSDKGELEEGISSFENFIQLSEDTFWKERAESRIKELRERINDRRYDQVFKIIDDLKEALIFADKNITHYTGIGTAKALILRQSKFRISEASFLNDTSEGKPLYKYLEVIDFNIDDNENLVSEPYAEKPFIGSFVSPEQCDDLTLWRMYGKESNEEAKGCSITINKFDFIDDIKSEIDRKYGSKKPDQATEGSKLELDNELEFYRVAYIQDDDSISVPGANEKEKSLKKMLDQLKKKLSEYKGAALPVKVREKLSEISYLFKQAHYQYEREVRLVITGAGFEKTINDDFEPSRVYIELAPIISVIPSLTIGPKVEKAEEWAAAFYYSFKANNADCQISISRLPFK